MSKMVKIFGNPTGWLESPCSSVSNFVLHSVLSYACSSVNNVMVVVGVAESQKYGVAGQNTQRASLFLIHRLIE